MANKSRIEKCIIDKSWVTGTDTLVKQGRTGTESLRATGTETLITTAARNGGDEMVEWAGRGGESM
jgi:hypothetical protein